MMNPAHFKRIDAIDLLRGLSILAVMLLHLNINIPLNQSHLGAMLSPMTNKILLWSGYYGVITFFVISGFLITMTAIKRWGSLEKIQMNQFYLIRFARIFPCLIALIIFLTILDRIGLKGFVIDTENTTLTRTIIAALTFHINLLEAQTGYLPAAWGVLWSLSVEEVFYLCFPLICRWMKHQYFVLLMLAFIILGPFARVAFTTNDIWMDHSYLSCMDGIAFGCLAALFASKVSLSKKWLNTFMIFGLVLSLFIIIFRQQASQLGLTTLGLNVTMLELGIALLAIAFYGKSLNKTYTANPISWLGQYSYEVYLTHAIIVILFSNLFYSLHVSMDFAPLWYLAIILISSITGAFVSHFYSEPMNKKMRKYFSLMRGCQLQSNDGYQEQR